MTRTTYVAVPASQTHAKLSATGAIGNVLAGLIIVPAVAASGLVSIRDGDTGSDISIFVGGGTTALPSVAPFYLPLGLVSTVGGWEVTTGASVSVIAVGQFT